MNQVFCVVHFSVCMYFIEEDLCLFVIHAYFVSHPSNMRLSVLSVIHWGLRN